MYHENLSKSENEALYRLKSAGTRAFNEITEADAERAIVIVRDGAIMMPMFSPYKSERDLCVHAQDLMCAYATVIEDLASIFEKRFPNPEGANPSRHLAAAYLNDVCKQILDAAHKGKDLRYIEIDDPEDTLEKAITQHRAGGTSTTNLNEDEYDGIND